MTTEQNPRLREEERILKCPAQFWGGGPSCSNILRIKLFIYVNDGQWHKAGGVKYIEAIQESDRGTGCCLRVNRKRWLFQYGPLSVHYVYFVHCMFCRKKVSWRKFQKVNI